MQTGNSPQHQQRNDLETQLGSFDSTREALRWRFKVLKGTLFILIIVVVLADVVDKLFSTHVFEVITGGLWMVEVAMGFDRIVTQNTLNLIEGKAAFYFWKPENNE